MYREKWKEGNQNKRRDEEAHKQNIIEKKIEARKKNNICAHRRATMHIFMMCSKLSGQSSIDNK